MVIMYTAVLRWKTPHFGSLIYFYFLFLKTALKMISAHFWDITKGRAVTLYRRFETIIAPVFKGQEIQQEKSDFLTLEDGTNRLFPKRRYRVTRRA